MARAGKDLPPKPPHAYDPPPLTPDQAFRHGGWEPIRALVRRSLIETGQPARRIEAFDRCGDGAWVFWNEERPDEFKCQANRCRDRLCTPCANERSWQLRDALRELMEGKNLSFLTLTLAGGTDTLAERIDRLYAGFKNLRRHVLWEEKVRGGGAFLEIKWNDKSSRWHPHLHIIMDADYIEQGHLAQAWQSITRDSFIVHIRRVEDHKEASFYCTKYASKPLNMSFARDPVLLNEAVEALKGRRLCLTFGTWYGTKLDRVDEEKEDTLDELFNWKPIGQLHELHARACAGDTFAALALQKVRAYRWLQDSNAPAPPPLPNG